EEEYCTPPPGVSTIAPAPRHRGCPCRGNGRDLHSGRPLSSPARQVLRTSSGGTSMSERVAVDAPLARGPSPDWPQVPGFEILEELGRGGMGVVFKARKTDSGQLFAVKMIRDGVLASRQQRDRFRIEAEAVARMQHANIIRIHEVGEHAGRPYFVMELVQ